MKVGKRSSETVATCNTVKRRVTWSLAAGSQLIQLAINSKQSNYVKYR